MRRVALVVAAVLALGGVAIAASSKTPQTYKGPGGERTGLRPTGVGLPLIGAQATVGAGELSSALQRYHDSGAYGRDLAKVGGAAIAAMKRNLARFHGKGKPQCRTVYHPVTVRVVHKGKTHRERLYRRERACTSPSTIVGKPAIVLDIDETALSNYTGLVASGFTAAGAVAPAIAGTGTAITPTLELFNAAKKRKVAVFFVTGRPDGIQIMTETNLKAQGYAGWKSISFKPGDAGVKAFKAGARAKLEKQGYDILVNVGDQESDLDGGHADSAFKLPNPFYFVPD